MALGREAFVSVFEVILLGAIQGITEFLPVSSSGHLVLLETLFGLKSDTPEMLLFDLAVHLGTVGAVVIVFLQSSAVSRAGGGAVFDAGQGEPAEASKPVSAWRLLAMIVIATIATGILVMPIKHLFEQARGSLAFVGAMWIITGTLLWITDRKKHSRFDLGQFGLKGRFSSVWRKAWPSWPGISRSGATVCAPSCWVFTASVRSSSAS